MLLWQSLPRLASFALDRTFLYDLKSFKSWKFSFRRCYAQCKQRSVEDFKFKIFFFSFLAAMANDGSSSLCLRSNQRHKKTKTETLSVLSGVWGLSSFSFTGDGVTWWRSFVHVDFESSLSYRKKKKTSVLERKYKAPFYRASLYFVRSVLCTVCTQFF